MAYPGYGLMSELTYHVFLMPFELKVCTLFRSVSLSEYVFPDFISWVPSSQTSVTIISNPLCPPQLSSPTVTYYNLLWSLPFSCVFTTNNFSNSSVSIIRFFRGVFIISYFYCIVINVAFKLTVSPPVWNLFTFHSLFYTISFFKVLIYWIHSLIKFLCHSKCS